jgi:hypothetical protein
VTISELEAWERERKRYVRDWALTQLRACGERYSREVWLAMPERRNLFITCAFVQAQLAAMHAEGLLVMRQDSTRDKRGWLRNYYSIADG